ncbi:hypothetical protein TK45_14235 [Bowmanella sp. JS7-9]|nr:hypothetical protein TK45_14235 [Bowmanella sp. JS7-9]
MVFPLKPLSDGFERKCAGQVKHSNGYGIIGHILFRLYCSKELADSGKLLKDAELSLKSRPDTEEETHTQNICHGLSNW